MILVNLSNDNGDSQNSAEKDNETGKIMLKMFKTMLKNPEMWFKWFSGEAAFMVISLVLSVLSFTMKTFQP